MGVGIQDPQRTADSWLILESRNREAEKAERGAGGVGSPNKQR